MSEGNQILLKCKAPINPTLKRLFSICHKSKERLILNSLWHDQGILTHELGERFGFKSNNHHNISQDLNPRLIKLGWVISKYQSGLPSESWRWYLEPIHVALQKKIRKDLRCTIIKYMEAANDE